MKTMSHRIHSEQVRWFSEIGLFVKLRLSRRQGKITKGARRILIVNNALIGDTLASLPAVKSLIDSTNAEVDMVVSPMFEPLARQIKGIKRVYVATSVFKRELEGLKVDKARLGGYDLVLVMRISVDAHRLLKRVRYQRIKVPLEPYLKYAFEVFMNTARGKEIRSMEEFSLELVEEAGLDGKKRDFDDIFEFSKLDYERAGRLQFLRSKSRKVVIHTGSGWPVKLWADKNWAVLLRKLNRLGDFTFIFIGGTKQEEDSLESIRKGLDFKVYSVIRKMPIKDTALMMRRCDYFIGVDSGPRHIAHLLNMPSISIVGPGPRIFNPKGRNAVIIDKTKGYCPSVFCGTNLLCYRKESCVERITPNDVATEFKKMIKSSARVP